MLQRVRCILYIGVVTGLIGLTPAQCQQRRDRRWSVSSNQELGSRTLRSSTSTQCVSVPVRAAGASGAVLAAGCPGRLPRPENDMVRGAVPFVESEERRLGDELGAAAQHLPGELDRQQVLHVHGGAVTAAGLFLRGHHLAAVEPCGETQAVGAGSSRRHELRDSTGSREPIRPHESTTPTSRSAIE